MLFLVMVLIDLINIFCPDCKASACLRFASGISSSEERRFWEADVVGSIPTSPTIVFCRIFALRRAPVLRVDKVLNMLGALVFRQWRRYFDVTDSGAPRIGVTGSTCDFDSLGAGSYPASSSTRRHRHSENDRWCYFVGPWYKSIALHSECREGGALPPGPELWLSYRG
jgi:hypothetical protein